MQIKPKLRKASIASSPLPKCRFQFCCFRIMCKSNIQRSGSTAETSYCFERLRGRRPCVRLSSRLFRQTCLHHNSVAMIPESMDMETAASITLHFITAFRALHSTPRLKRGGTIAIHIRQDGNVGQALIMLAQFVEADVFVTTKSKEKYHLMHFVQSPKTVSSTARMLISLKELWHRMNVKG